MLTIILLLSSKACALLSAGEHKWRMLPGCFLNRCCHLCWLSVGCSSGPSLSQPFRSSYLDLWKKLGLLHAFPILHGMFGFCIQRRTERNEPQLLGTFQCRDPQESIPQGSILLSCFSTDLWDWESWYNVRSSLVRGDIWLHVPWLVNIFTHCFRNWSFRQHLGNESFNEEQLIESQWKQSQSDVDQENSSKILFPLCWRLV